jgi:hypothetical protein
MAPEILTFQRKTSSLPKKEIIPISAARRKSLHDALDYILDHGQKSLRLDAAEHVAFSVTLIHEQLKEELNALALTNKKIASAFPGLSLKMYPCCENWASAEMREHALIFNGRIRKRRTASAQSSPCALTTLTRVSSVAAPSTSTLKDSLTATGSHMTARV